MQHVSRGSRCESLRTLTLSRELRLIPPSPADQNNNFLADSSSRRTELTPQNRGSSVHSESAEPPRNPTDMCAKQLRVNVKLRDVLERSVVDPLASYCRNTAGTTLPRNGNVQHKQRWCFRLGARALCRDHNIVGTFLHDILNNLPLCALPRQTTAIVPDVNVQCASGLWTPPLTVPVALHHRAVRRVCSSLTDLVERTPPHRILVDVLHGKPT